VSGRDDELGFAIERFLESQTDDFTTRSRVVNQLLNLWATAQELGPEVAAPLETLLGASTQRSLISRAELVAVLTEVRALASAAAKASRPS